MQIFNVILVDPIYLVRVHYAKEKFGVSGHDLSGPGPTTPNNFFVIDGILGRSCLAYTHLTKTFVNFKFWSLELNYD
jgi:hypothetical protein